MADNSENSPTPSNPSVPPNPSNPSVPPNPSNPSVPPNPSNPSVPPKPSNPLDPPNPSNSSNQPNSSVPVSTSSPGFVVSSSPHVTKTPFSRNLGFFQSGNRRHPSKPSKPKPCPSDLESHKEENETNDVNENEEKIDGSPENVWLKVNNCTLTLTDKEILESKTETDGIINSFVNAGQRLLAKKFPTVYGLLTVSSNPDQEIDHEYAIVKRMFVQILLNFDHWIVVSNIKVRDREKEVKIYDSRCILNHVYSEAVKINVRNFMGNSESIKVSVEYVSQQHENNDYGLYALAFAYTLCDHKDPSNILYTDSLPMLKNHFMRCLKTATISSFPTGSQTILSSYTLKALKQK